MQQHANAFCFASRTHACLLTVNKIALQQLESCLPLQVEQMHAKSDMQQHLRAEQVRAKHLRAESKQQFEGKKTEAGTQCFC